MHHLDTFMVLFDKPVFLTVALLGKRVVDEGDNGLALIGTFIVNVISSLPEHTLEIPLRVNDILLQPECMTLRRRRTTRFPENPDEQDEIKAAFVETADAYFGNDSERRRPLILGFSGDSDRKESERQRSTRKQAEMRSMRLHGMCYTYNVKFPIELEQKSYPSFPFSVSKARLKLEFSTITVEHKQGDIQIQLRPQILGHYDASLNGLFSFGRIERRGDDFDSSVRYDFANLAPYIRVLGESNRYYPGVEFEWSVTGYFVKNMLGTWIPLSVLLILQWFNYFQVLETGSPQTYYTNAITLVLAVIFLLPTIMAGRALHQHKLTVLDAVIFLYFTGTAISTYPTEEIAFIGLNISTFALVFPLLQGIDYLRWKRHEIDFGNKPQWFKVTNHRDGEAILPDELKVRNPESQSIFREDRKDFQSIPSMICRF